MEHSHDALQRFDENPANSNRLRHQEKSKLTADRKRLVSEGANLLKFHYEVGGGVGLGLQRFMLKSKSVKSPKPHYGGGGGGGSCG